MKTIINTININQIRAVKILLAMVVMLIVTYLYLINSIAFTTANFDRVSKNISLIQTEIAVLESDLLRSTKEISMEMGIGNNLIRSNISSATFVDRTETAKITLNE